MSNSDGPDYQKLFDIGLLQPAVADHYELITRFLNFLVGTPGYVAAVERYILKGYSHPVHTPMPVDPSLAVEAPVAPVVADPVVAVDAPVASDPVVTDPVPVPPASNASQQSE